MAGIGWLISLVARVVLRSHWPPLRTELLRLHGLHLKEPSSAPPRIVQAFLITAEDHRFFSHRGVDPVAIARAAWRRFAANKREGASTIEMQLVRVLTGRFERTLSRKLREAGLATLLRSVVRRSDLPSLYLRVAYYGTGMTGFSQACRRLDIDPQDVSPAQAASLVARLKYPQPSCSYGLAQARIDRRTGHLLRIYDRHAARGIHRGVIAEFDYAAL